MKKSLIILMSLAMALCLALGTLAAPTAVDAADSAVESAESVDSSTLMADGTLETAPETTIEAWELMSVAVRLHSLLNEGGLTTDYNLDTYYAYATNNGIFEDGVYTSETQIPTRAQVVSALYNAVNGKIDLTEINSVLDMIDVDPNADYYASALAFMKAGIVYGFDDYGSFYPENTVKRYELALMVDRLLNPSERVTKTYTVYSSAEPFYLIDDFLHDIGAHSTYTGGSGWRIDYTGSKEIGTINQYANILRDYAIDDDMSTSRRFHTQENGELVFEAVFKIISGNTFGVAFYDVDGNEAVTAGFNAGYAYLGSETTAVSLDDVKQAYDATLDSSGNYGSNANHYLQSRVRMRLVLDLDNNECELWLGTNTAEPIATASLTAANLGSTKIFTGYETVSVIDIEQTHLYKNYVVNDVFRLENQDAAPVGYTTSGDVTVRRIEANANNTGEFNSMRMVTASGTTTSASKSFDKAEGKIVAEAYVLLDDSLGFANSSSDFVTYSELSSYEAYNKSLTNSAYFTLTSAGEEVITVKNDGNKWYVGTTKLDLKTVDDTFTSNTWQKIRIEADLPSMTATVKINGTVAGTVSIVKADGIDGLEVGVVGAEDDVVWFDDILVHETFDYDDYCPEPEPLDTGDYVLNMSVCNLWRNGSHYGWDWIRPFSELEPALGYYDEGIPEQMDWEIKYLTEHGISNYMTCWYPITGNVPLKKPRMVDALNDGYMNAKYADLMTFSLMHENSGQYTDAHYHDFINVVFPYWMENYFSDERYCRIEQDGKKYIFLTIYQYLMFLDMCYTDEVLLEANSTGDGYKLKSTYSTVTDGVYTSTSIESAVQATADVIDWMEQQIIDAGYADGLIVCFGGSANTNEAYNTMARISSARSIDGGADRSGIILYAWGRTAWDVETQKNLATTHMTYAKNNSIDMLTLAAAGFNDIGWTTLRKGYMTTDNFDTMLDWHKGRMSTEFDTSSWKSKLITFDTWNEYGEGHYFFPTKAHDDRLGYGGFGYLDVIAENFGGPARGSDEAEANNTYPTAIQQARVAHLYPQDIDHYIRREMIEEAEYATAFTTLGGYSSFSDTSAVTTFYTYTGTECTNTSFLHSCGSTWSSCTYDTYTYPSYDSTKGALYLKSSPTCSTSSPMRIDLEEALSSTTGISGVDMDEVSYIHLTMGTSTGGSTGKIYFKNTTDTSEYDGYAESRIFRFDTYVDGSDSCEYWINVKEHSDWTGTLAGIMLECTNEPDEEVWIYGFEFVTEDDSTRKPTFYVDDQKYVCKDYSEIRGDFSNTNENWVNDIWMCPTEEGGLFKLLHMVNSWNRSTNVLTLDTPNGTTFQFTVGSRIALVNGESVTLEQEIELYDGAPVIPMLYILDTAGYYYSYDFYNKYVYVTVANEFQMDDQIVNGDAEGAETSAFYSGSSSYTVTVETDTYDSNNHVWQANSVDSKIWTYIRTNFTWEKGKTYTINFDARRTGNLANGNDHPADTSVLVFNARYPDTDTTVQNQLEHNPAALKSSISDEWKHFTLEYTVNDTLDESSTTAHTLTFYVDPYCVDSTAETYTGVPFQIDNLIVTEDPVAFGYTMAVDTTNKVDGFGTSNTSNTVTIDGTAVTSTCGDTSGGTWNYLIQETTYEKGVTYYYKVKAKIGANAAGTSTSTNIALNARYADYAQMDDPNYANEWFAHTQYLADSTGTRITFNTGDDWQYCYGSFTISQGYVPVDEWVKPDGFSKSSPAEQISFYANPDSSYGVTFSIDEFEVTTDVSEYESWLEA